MQCSYKTPCIPSSESTACSKWHCVGITRAEFLGVTAGYLTKTQHVVSQFGCKMYPTDAWTQVMAMVGITGLPRQEAYHCRVGLWGLWPSPTSSLLGPECFLQTSVLTTALYPLTACRLERFSCYVFLTMMDHSHLHTMSQNRPFLFCFCWEFSYNVENIKSYK